MGSLPKEPSLADVSTLLKETGEWMDIANHAQTEIEWRMDLLTKLLPLGDPMLLALMNDRGRKH